MCAEVHFKIPFNPFLQLTLCPTCLDIPTSPRCDFRRRKTFFSIVVQSCTLVSFSLGVGRGDAPLWWGGCQLSLYIVDTLSNMLGLRCDFKEETFFFIVVDSCTHVCFSPTMIGVGRAGCTMVVRWVSIGGLKEHRRAENKLCVT